MLQQLRNSRLYWMILLESVLFTLAFVTAFFLRFEFTLTPGTSQQVLQVLPFLIPAKLTVFFLFGLYKGMWRYSSIYDFWRLCIACICSSAVVVVLVLFAYGFTGFSRSVFFLDGLLTLVVTGANRLLIRTYYSAKTKRGANNVLPVPFQRSNGKPAKRILIIGAGGSAEKLVREIFDNPGIHFHIVGFLDDDSAKVGRAIHGIPIMGTVESLPAVLEEHDIHEVILSIPSATGPQMRRIVELCEKCGARYRTLPAIGQILDERVSIGTLREIRYEDLLRRPPVKLDKETIRDYLSNRRVMVTGAGGSIGSELCRQVIRFQPKALILVDAGEANLYDIQMELRHKWKFNSSHTVLTKVQNRAIMEDIFDTHRPEVVFHAAAYKHVPILERNPWEAVYNNILGSRVVMEMSAKFGVDRFVLVSTDKAVRPTNVMGASKRLAELTLKSMNGVGTTRFIAVRFGNVLASSGSVIPLFRKQIELGGPVTVTHPEVTRYFMTIPEASQLILQAGAMGEGGEIFVLEMGTPVKIADMAMDLIRLSGKEPEKDIQVIYTGLRVGEKLYEELITHGEEVISTQHEKIMILNNNNQWDWSGLHSQDHFRTWLNLEIDHLATIAARHDACAIKKKLQQIIPEYTPQKTTCDVLDLKLRTPIKLAQGNNTLKL